MDNLPYGDLFFQFLLLCGGVSLLGGMFNIFSRGFGLANRGARRTVGYIMYAAQTLTCWMKRKLFRGAVQTIFQEMPWTTYIIAGVIGLPGYVWKKLKSMGIQMWLYIRANKLRLFFIFTGAVALGVLYQKRRLRKLQEKEPEKVVEIELQRNNFSTETGATGEVGPVTDVVRRSVLAATAYVAALGAIKGTVSTKLLGELIFLVGAVLRFMATPFNKTCWDGAPCCPRKGAKGLVNQVLTDCSCQCHVAPADVVTSSKQKLETRYVMVTNDERTRYLEANGGKKPDNMSEDSFNYLYPEKIPKPVTVIVETDDTGAGVGTGRMDEERELDAGLYVAEVAAEELGERDVAGDIKTGRQVLQRVRGLFKEVLVRISAQFTSINVVIAAVAIVGFALGSVCYFYWPTLKKRGLALCEDASALVSDKPVITEPPKLEEESRMQMTTTTTVNEERVSVSQPRFFGIVTEKGEIVNTTTNTTVSLRGTVEVPDEEVPLDKKRVTFVPEVETKGKTKKKVSKHNFKVTGRQPRRAAKQNDATYTNTASDTSSITDIEEDDGYYDRLDMYSDDDEPLVGDEYGEDPEEQRRYLSRFYDDYTVDLAVHETKAVLNAPEVVSVAIPTDAADIRSGQPIFCVESKGQIKVFIYECPLCPKQTHPIGRCPKNKAHDWKFISKVNAKLGACPSEAVYITENGFIYNSKVVGWDSKSRMLIPLGAQSRIEGVPIIEIEPLSAMVIPLFDAQHNFVHNGIPLGNYIAAPHHGHPADGMMFVRRVIDDQENFEKLDLAEMEPNVPAIWGTDDLVWYKKPQAFKSIRIGAIPADTEKDKVLLVGYHNGKLAFSGPRPLLTIEDSPVSNASLKMITHDNSSDFGFSGGALVNVTTMKVFAIHLGSQQKGKQNYGVILADPKVNAFLTKPPPKVPKSVTAAVAAVSNSTNLNS